MTILVISKFSARYSPGWVNSGWQRSCRRSEHGRKVFFLFTKYKLWWMTPEIPLHYEYQHLEKILIPLCQGVLTAQNSWGTAVGLGR